MAASAFLGYSVLVTLRFPQDAKVRGVVADVANQKLHLRDAILWNGQHVPSFTIESTAVADLEVLPEVVPAEDDLVTPTVAVQAGYNEPQQNVAVNVEYMDPAILSYRKPPERSGTGTSAVSALVPPGPVSPVMIADGAVPSPASHRPIAGKQSSVSSIATQHPTIVAKPAQRKDSDATAILTEPFDALALDGNTTAPVVAKGRKAKRGGKKTVDTTSHTGPGIIDLKDIDKATLPSSKRSGKRAGWRQTPIIEELPKNTGRSKRAGRKALAEDPNGWATEDATDIQDMGEFDFVANLNKFDKKRVFDDIRRDDTTADTDRLVSFNRIARPGTYGGRNLHPTENVLDMPDKVDGRWKSEAGETDDDVRDEQQYSSGRGSRRAASRLAPSRKSSVHPGHSTITASPQPIARLATASPLNGSTGSNVHATFKIAGSNKTCQCVSPLQMLEIEQLCSSDLGLTEDILAENAGRSIAQAVLQVPSTRVVLFLVGNHKSGARAIAAARHLRNRRLRVTVVVLGGEREDLLLETMRKQLSLYKKGQGMVNRWDEFQGKLASGGPLPDVIVDALLGLHVNFDELRTDDQATVYEMLRWANRVVDSAPTPQKSPIPTTLSIDVPAGISAHTGLIQELDGQLLVVSSKIVLSLGAPKTGLLLAMVASEFPWELLLADIGISVAAWQKQGNRRKQGVDFGTDWILKLKLDSVSAVY